MSTWRGAASGTDRFLYGFSALNLKGPRVDVPLSFPYTAPDARVEGIASGGVKMHVFMDVSYPPRQGRGLCEAFQEGFALVEAADQWGLDGVWLGEMHFNPARSVLGAPIVVASSIATRTHNACGWAWPCRCCP